MSTQRYKLLIAYRGSRYHGWQKQLPVSTWKGPMPPPGRGIPTIQEIVSRELGAVVGHPVSLVGSSRTDAGVHAKGQVAHFDTSHTTIPIEGMRRAVNHQLPDDILIRSIEPVKPEFDAIFSTISKRYQYFIWNTLDRNPFYPELSWHRWQPLNTSAMRAAAEHFIGVHDFTSFSRPGHGRGTSVREILDCSVSSVGPRIVIGVDGTGFLWNMVRIMVGTLVDVGMERFAPAEMPGMIAARDRRAAGATAPPEGLYLQWVKMRAEHLISAEPV